MAAKRASMPTVHKVRAHWMQEWNMPLPIGQCWCCHRMAEVQRAHLVAARSGGGSEPSNLMLTCRLCNHWLDQAVCESGLEAAIAWVRLCQAEQRVIAPPSHELMRMVSEYAARHGFALEDFGGMDRLWRMRVDSGFGPFG